MSCALETRTDRHTDKLTDAKKWLKRQKRMSYALETRTDRYTDIPTDGRGGKE